MATPNQESIDTFMSITGSSELVAVQKLTEHGGNLNGAVNAHFTEGDTNIRRETDVADPEEDFMDIDEPSEVATNRPPFSPYLPARDGNPLSLLDSHLNRHIIDSGQGFMSGGPCVSHPVDGRQVPIEVKDGTSSESHLPERAPTVENATETLPENVSETHGTLSIDDDDYPSLRSCHPAVLREQDEGVSGGISHGIHSSPSAPGVGDLPDYGIEEEMIQAAIEASKRVAEIGRSGYALPRQRSRSEDLELAHAVSLSLKSAEQEKAFRELEYEAGPSETTASNLVEVEEVEVLASSNARFGVLGSSIQDETEDVDEQPLVRHRSRHMSSISTHTAKNTGEVDLSLPSGSPQQRNAGSENDLPSDEWGGISSEEHDEAVMLEAAMFGGMPEGAGFHVPYAPHHYIQNGLGRTAPRPPSPSLTAQRLIRMQQDDEYLASLQADREKELQAQAAREAAMEEERRKEEEAQRKLEEEQEVERQLARKEASLPQEPTSDDENAVTILVRMPDGSRRGRLFLRNNKLQYLFDFIDVGRVVKPRTYRLVRPYPRQAYGDGESDLTLNELGLTSKQEALFLELI